MYRDRSFIMRLATLLAIAVLALPCLAENIQFIYVSDTHYGLFRKFRGEDKVSSVEVNRAMIDKMNLLPALMLPLDGGVKQGEPVGGIDLIINTGDVVSRSENGVQSSSSSWKDFATDWIDGRLEFYTWGGPDSLLALPVIRVESTMKGEKSKEDESLLSFQLITIDTDTMQMTVRECLWNVTDSQQPIVWGASHSLSL